MKKQNKVDRTLRNIVYTQERRWKTKKAKKAHLYIISAILFMLTVDALIYGLQSKTFTIENKRFVTSIEAESAKPKAERKDEVKDGNEVGGLEAMIAEKFPEDPKTAIAIAKAESGLKTDNVGDGHIMYLHEGKPMGMSCGTFQIRVLPGRPDCESLKDIKTNLDFARKLYEKSGWKPWSAYTNQSYLKFLN